MTKFFQRSPAQKLRAKLIQARDINMMMARNVKATDAMSPRVLVQCARRAQWDALKISKVR